jgi:hypothetical protein
MLAPLAAVQHQHTSLDVDLCHRRSVMGASALRAKPARREAAP